MTDDLKAEHRYCGYCGARMEEMLVPSPTFDRKTGKQGHVGYLYWQCPKRGSGLDEIAGDWLFTHDENPHDTKFLRNVTA